MSFKSIRQIKKYRFLSPLIIGLLLFLIIPMIQVFLESLSIDQYQGVVKSNAFWLAIKNTSKFSIIAYTLLIVLGISLAIIIEIMNRKTVFIFSCLLLPYVLPVSTVVQVWRMFFERAGLLNHFLLERGLESVSWLESYWAFWVVLILFIWRNLGLFTLVFYYGLKTIPKIYYEVAEIEGAKWFQKIIHITLVQLIPFIFFNTILFMINGFKIFREIYMLSGDYPDESVYMIQHYLNNLFTSFNLDRLSSATILFLLGYAILISIGYFLIYRKIEETS